MERRKAHQEEEAAAAVAGCKAGARAQHCIRDRRHCALLPDHALVQLVLEVQQLLNLRLLQPVHGDARPSRHHLRGQHAT